MTTETAPPPPPPPTRPPASGTRLTRRTDAEDRLLAGVAGGLADHFGLDPLLVRIGFVLLALFGGSGVALYVVLWLLVPLRGEDEAMAQRFVREGQDRIGSDRGPAFWFGVVLIAFAGIVLLGIDGTFAWALVLIVVGVVLFQSDSVDTRPPDREPVLGQDHSTVSGVVEDVVPGDHLDEVGTEQAWAVPPAPPVPPGRVARSHGRPPRPPRPPRERSMLGRLTLGVAVLWVGGASLFNSLDLGTSVTAAGVVGIAMAIVGAGLLVGAWVGRARWLVLVGVLLVPFLGGATVVDRVQVDRGAGVGLRHVDVEPGTTLVAEEWFAGDLQIHLTDLPPDHPDVRVEAAVGFGELEVIVPRGWGVELAARVGGGEIAVADFDEFYPTASGIGARVDRTLATPEPGYPTVTLDLSADFGQVHVVRWYVEYQEVS